MAEMNEEMLENKQPNPSATEPLKKSGGAGAAIKEFFRKRTVKLKRKPQTIFILFLALIAVFYLLVLTVYSEFVIRGAKDVEWIGLLVFVNTLLSILVLVSALGMYPKMRKKGSKLVVEMREKGSVINVNLFMFAVTVVFIVVMIICEVYYIKIVTVFQAENYTPDKITEASMRQAETCAISLKLSLTHIILLGIASVLMLTLPLYRKLIMMIDTSVVLESAAENMQEIDLQD